MCTAPKKFVGRPPLIDRGDDTDKVVCVGLKMRESLEDRFKKKVKELRRLGIKTSKSELIRLLAEYSLDWANDIYVEREANK